MLLILGTFRLNHDRQPAALAAMTTMITASRSEAGCLDYGYARDLLDPGLLHVKEVWADRAAFEAHLGTRHIAEWRAAWPALGIAERRLLAYEVEAGAPV